MTTRIELRNFKWVLDRPYAIIAISKEQKLGITVS